MANGGSITHSQQRDFSLRVACLDDESRDGHYQAIREATPNWDWRYIKDAESELIAGRYDIAITTDEFCDLWALRVQIAKRANIPTLHLVDGIAEWRNIWQNPRSLSGGMPLFQPILCDKIACLGSSQARILESWGNLGKCEIVGSARFDKYLNFRPRAPSEEFNLLVITARTPAFTPEQFSVTKRSLTDLKAWLDAHPVFEGKRVATKWRIGQALCDKIGIETTARDDGSTELNDSLNTADAVISTASTSVLEAMLAGLPVALLDYHNCPQFVSAAWYIPSREFIEPAVGGLIAKPLHRMLYQRFLLHESLECRTPATPRIIELIDKMAQVGRDCRRLNRPLRLPVRLVSHVGLSHHMPDAEFDMSALYPMHPVFAEMDRAVLQAELGHCRAEILTLQKRLANMSQNATVASKMSLAKSRLAIVTRAVQRIFPGLVRFCRGC